MWWYWNASGGYLEGTASIGADGAITTEGQNHGDASQLDRTRSTIRITADGWTFTPSYEKDRVWNNEPSRTYRSFGRYVPASTQKITSRVRFDETLAGLHGASERSGITAEARGWYRDPARTASQAPGSTYFTHRTLAVQLAIVPES